MLKIANRICVANCDAIGKKCVKNDKENLAVTDQEKLFAWQEHYESLPNAKFDKDPTYEPRPKIEVETVKKALSRMECGKASDSSRAVTEMLRASGEVGIGRMTDLSMVS